MHDDRTGQTAVIFMSNRNGTDPAGYAAAAAAMEALAATQPGYRGIDSVRDQAGLGITISYWADDAAAIAWRVVLSSSRRPPASGRGFIELDPGSANPASGSAGPRCPPHVLRDAATGRRDRARRPTG